MGATEYWDGEFDHPPYSELVSISCSVCYEYDIVPDDSAPARTSICTRHDVWR